MACRDSVYFENLIGYCLNVTVVAAHIQKRTTFEQLVEQQRATVIEALTHKHYPLSTLLQRLKLERDPSRNPLFQTAFVLQNPHEHAEFVPFIMGQEGGVINVEGLELQSMNVPFFHHFAIYVLCSFYGVKEYS